MRHACHAEGCARSIPRKLLFCGRHWRLVPRALQVAVWRAYQPGQEQGRTRPSAEYLDAAARARRYVAEAEGRRAVDPNRATGACPPECFWALWESGCPHHGAVR